MADPMLYNALEHALSAVQAGRLPPSRLFAALDAAAVYVFVDEPLGPEGWRETTTLMILNGPSGHPAVGVFTAPERAIGWPERAGAFKHGLRVDFSWLAAGLADGVGIAINPDSELAVELPPALVRKLRERARGVQ